MQSTAHDLDDVPTLRIVTLRSLLAHRAPVVLPADAPAATLARVHADAPAAIVALVDRTGLLIGTRRARDRAIVRDAPQLRAKDDVDTARTALRRAGADRALVVTADGQLLGILGAEDLGLL